MPCYTRRRRGQTEAARKEEIRRSVARLEAALDAGSVRVVIGPQGAIAFEGWTERDDVTDVCAYRTLVVDGSFALRQAVARAEATSGRKVSEAAVAAGTHSHDGGSTWAAGH